MTVRVVGSVDLYLENFCVCPLVVLLLLVNGVRTCVTLRVVNLRMYAKLLAHIVKLTKQLKLSQF